MKFAEALAGLSDRRKNSAIPIFTKAFRLDSSRRGHLAPATFRKNQTAHVDLFPHTFPISVARKKLVLAADFQQSDQAMCPESISTQCDSLRDYLRKFAPAMDPDIRNKYEKEVDQTIGLLMMEHQIKNGLLMERVATIKRLIPRGSRGSALEKIAAVRDLDVRAFYPRRDARRRQRVNTPGARPVVPPDPTGPGAESGGTSRTDVLKRELTEESKRRFGGDGMCPSDEELATSFARAFLRRRSAVGEDLLATLRRISALMEAKIITETQQPEAAGAVVAGRLIQLGELKPSLPG